MKFIAAGLALFFFACPAASPPAAVESAHVELTGRLVLPLSFLVRGVPETTRGELFLRNVGAAGTSLSITRVFVEGDPELCLGALEATSCAPWTPPETVAAGELVRVPVQVRATSVGPRRWSVVVESNDAVRPRVTAEVLALVEDATPCSFDLPSEVLLATDLTLRVKHHGPGRCVVRGVAVTDSTAIRLAVGRALPATLEGNDDLTLQLSREPRPFTGAVLRISALGTPETDVTVWPDPSRAACIVAGSVEVELESPGVGCSSRAVNVVLYNACPRSVRLERASLSSSEFFFTSHFQPGASLAAGEHALVGVRYLPRDEGADTAELTVRTTEQYESRVRLRGRAAPAEQIVERVETPRLPRSDAIILVDVSPSFVPRRAALRALLEQRLRRGPCADQRLAFAPADGANDGGVRLVTNDAGAPWSHSLEPNFVGRALSAFDALPVGSEVEACIGPAADLFTSADLRPDVPWVGACITDALEQTPQPLDALQRVVAHRDGGSFTWVAEVAETSACMPEAIDDGTHAALALATGGAILDVCVPGGPLAPEGCATRWTYSLESKPAGAVEVFVDGQPVPSDEWRYDALRNAVEFRPEVAPGNGAVIEFKYARSCLP